MKKIWARIIFNDKIKKEFILNLNTYNAKNLYDYLKEICYNLKIETPIVLPKHINQMQEYGMTKFSSSDFIDFITFDSLIISYFES